MYRVSTVSYHINSYQWYYWFELAPVKACKKHMVSEHNGYKCLAITYIRKRARQGDCKKNENLHYCFQLSQYCCIYSLLLVEADDSG